MLAEIPFSTIFMGMLYSGSIVFCNSREGDVPEKAGLTWLAIARRKLHLCFGETLILREPDNTAMFFQVSERNVQLANPTVCSRLSGPGIIPSGRTSANKLFCAPAAFAASGLRHKNDQRKSL